MKKKLKESNEEKKLIAASFYFNLYMDTLEEVVDKDSGDIFFREYGYINCNLWIEKKRSKCWVVNSFWKKFSELFSLELNEIQSLITRWVEDTYQLRGIETELQKSRQKPIS